VTTMMVTVTMVVTTMVVTTHGDDGAANMVIPTRWS
jgi:hypothetical protein